MVCCKYNDFNLVFFHNNAENYHSEITIFLAYLLLLSKYQAFDLKKGCPKITLIDIMDIMRLYSFVVFLNAFFESCSVLSSASSSKPPNILFFLTDDHDYSKLTGLEPLSKARQWIAEKGVSFENAFATVPLCCPSRASILTGLYQHNTNVLNNNYEGNCYGPEWIESTEKNTFATALKSSGYTTYYAGKYLNCYCLLEECDVGKAPDLSVPPGWDNWAGLCGNTG